jgi:pimeloyl-ACP methyl ester carboxylesterase
LLRTYWDVETSSFAYFGKLKSANTHVLAFEGSQDWKDWLVNLQVIALVPYKQYPEAKVHSGFWKAYNDLKQQIYQTIRDHNVTNLLVTGHSLGGALATVCALDLSEELHTPLNLTHINYGSPRVGNKAYSQLFFQLVKANFRVTHAKDFVVHLPQFIFGYYHTANEVYYPDDTLKYTQCPQAEDDHCSRGVTSWPWDTKDHQYYLKMMLSQC